MRLHNDEPSLIDQLGRKALVRRLGDDIATCIPPYTFGVHGDWGAGKTSFLHQLQFYLTGACPQHSTDDLTAARKRGLEIGLHKHVTVVWFEAWRYQNEDAPIVALLQEIRTQLPWYAKALSEAHKLGEVAIRSAFLAFEDLTKKIGIQASKIQETGERWEKEHLSGVLPSHVIRQQLEHALGALLGEAGDRGSGKNEAPRPRLVVMVDDLDRCDSEAAYKLLEGIKIYLNLPSCVFVLGMNQKVIEGAFANHLPKTDDGTDRALRAREYLEKICHSIVHLPLLKEPANLLAEYLADLSGFETIYSILRKYRCLPCNPRRVKAFSNLLRSYAPRYTGQLGKSRLANAAAKRIVIFGCLYQFHPDLYRLVEAHPDFYEQIRRWAHQDKTHLEHPVFSGLMVAEHALAKAGSESDPVSEPLLGSAYPDPAEGNVLRLQRLIREFGAIPASEVRRHLVI